MRIIGDTKVHDVSVEFKKDSQTVPCSNILKSKVSENVVDIRCENSTLTIDSVTLSVSGQTSICSVHISGGRYIGLEQDARQSTVAFEGYAQNAVDGDTDGNYDHYSCTHTKTSEDFSWWELSLKTPVIPSTYKLYNRDRNLCRLTQFNVNSYNDNSLRGRQYWGASAQGVVTMDSGTSEHVNSVNITYSKVNRCGERFNIITLCEVEIYGEPATECPLGRYGRECELACQCSQPSEPCYVSTGMCAAGCPDGYMGEGCWTECGPGRWGKDCAQFCSLNCFNGTCDRVTGECVGGCTRGFLPPNCEDGCGPGYHGYNCTERCSTSCYNSSCNANTGVCDSCIAGYQADYCDQECLAKTWGKNCKEACDG
ncbi:scavenger receptor class F member 1, partial [Aplysia californica]|uniref:Scavenger receptor class F member 1 n=1 Tax=Aplysia californica TaxID=6500 RepID=A0ABM0ZYS4_APLCA